MGDCIYVRNEFAWKSFTIHSTHIQPAEEEEEVAINCRTDTFPYCVPSRQTDHWRGKRMRSSLQSPLLNISIHHTPPVKVQRHTGCCGVITWSVSPMRSLFSDRNRFIHWGGHEFFMFIQELVSLYWGSTITRRPSKVTANLATWLASSI